MLTTVVETPTFCARAERLLEPKDRAVVITTIAANPMAGVVIKGTGGLRKLRIVLPGRGKSGGGRIIYWYHSPAYPVVLLLVFAKNEASDLTPDQRKILMRATQSLLDDFGAKR